MKHSLHKLPLTNSFMELGDAFYSRVQPTPFKTVPKLIHYNQQAADLLDLHPEAANDPQLAAVFSGAQSLHGAEPIAMLYAGHQFGHYVPQLGDGRAILLGETTNQNAQKWEIQLKGSGLTPYSRDGDGRAVLRSTIREYLCSEAIHGLGIPTTRALCMVGSNDEVYREQIEPGAMLTRLAPSHVRFGSFEVFFYRNQYDHLRQLADFVIANHHPELTSAPDVYARWLDIVIDRTASLIAQWQLVGFAHGVMNTDNMSVLGLTLDYGPFGFMEAYDPGFICNHSDHHGRYAFNQQPNIGIFNLSCFAQAILPVLAGDDAAPAINQAVETAKELLEHYHPRYLKYYASGMRAKLGLQRSLPGDETLARDLLDLMSHDVVDYTILFRTLCHFSEHDDARNDAVRDLFINREAFDRWALRYKQRLQQESCEPMQRQEHMKRTNPKYILRNYMAETAIRSAQDDKDYSEIDRLIRLLQSPYDEQPEHGHYANHPPDWAKSLSVSCSS